MVLQSLYNVCDEQTEFLIPDRLSFTRFLDLGLEDAVPDATTIWLLREALAGAGLIDKLFDRFGQHPQAKGYIARGGQIPDQVRDRCDDRLCAQAAQHQGGENRGCPTPSRSRRRPIASCANGLPTPLGLLHLPEPELSKVHYEARVGMPSSRSPPPGLGIATRLTDCGR